MFYEFNVKVDGLCFNFSNGNAFNYSIYYPSQLFHSMEMFTLHWF